MCDRIGIFAAGRLIGQGTMRDLAARFGDGRAHLEVGLDLSDPEAIERAQALFSGIDGVTAVTVSERPSLPWNLAVKSAAEEARVRSEVLAIVAREGLPLTSIMALVPSLEDIYRRAVAGPRVGAGAVAGLRHTTWTRRRRRPVLPHRPRVVARWPSDVVLDHGRATPVGRHDGAGCHVQPPFLRAAAAAGHRPVVLPSTAEAPTGTADDAGGDTAPDGDEHDRDTDSGTTAPSATGPRGDAVTYHEPKGGWLIVATKEFTDHLLSVRFVVLLVLMALAAAVPLYFLADNIRSAPQAAGSNIPALFLGLFWVAPSVNADLSLPSVVGFIGLVGPLLGLAFAFDAINGERARGTLPRLLSQPIHRDDVINGKFVAGLVRGL